MRNFFGCRRPPSSGPKGNPRTSSGKEEGEGGDDRGEGNEDDEETHGKDGEGTGMGMGMGETKGMGRSKVRVLRWLTGMRVWGSWSPGRSVKG